MRLILRTRGAQETDLGLEYNHWVFINFKNAFISVTHEKILKRIQRIREVREIKEDTSTNPTPIHIELHHYRRQQVQDQ